MKCNRRAYKTVVLLLAFLSCHSLYADAYRLWYLQPAKNWYEALPLGNGRMGAMVFGDVRTERIQLSEETLWSGNPTSKVVDPRINEVRDSVRSLLFEDRYEEAAALLHRIDRTQYEGDDGVEIVGVTCMEHRFETLCNLWIYQELPQLPYSDYQRELTLDDAVSRVSFKVGETTYLRESFCSYPEQLFVSRLTASEAAKVSFDLSLSRPVDMNESWVERQNSRSLIAPYPVKVETISSNEVCLQGTTSNNGIAFQTNIRVVIEGGEITSSNGTIRVENATSATLLVAATSAYYNYKRMDKELDKRLDRGEKLAYDKLISSHVDDYAPIYNRVQLTLDKNHCSKLPTDMRLRRLKQGVIDPRQPDKGDYDADLSALFYQYSRYLFIATTRRGTLPASLQYWNYSLSPNWYGRMTTNVNLEANFWGAETANLSDLHEPLLTMATNYLPAGEEVAAKAYKAQGAVFPGRGISIYGPEYIYDTWNDAGAWIGQHFWEHYLFTKDEVFLREQAYPYMKKMAQFYLDVLVQDPHTGYLMTGPSHSPENTFMVGDEHYSIDNGITMSRAIIAEIFRNTIRAAEQLHTDADVVAQMQATLAKLQPYQIGRYGIQEWRKDYDEVTAGHRHISHLYGLYPSAEITASGDTALYEGARRSFLRRLDNGGFWTSWSCAWGIGMAARLKDSDNAFRLTKHLIKDMTFDNLLSTHSSGGSSYDVFSMDGNLASIGAMTEMFVQSHDNDTIELLPALPSEWRNGAIRGLCARGGYRVDMVWEEGILKSAKLYSKFAGRVTVKYQEHIWEVNCNSSDYIEVKL